MNFIISSSDLLKSLQGGEQVDGKSKYVVAPDKSKDYKIPDAWEKIK